MTLKSKIYDLVKARVGSETLIFADQNSPRPPLPYWTLKVNVERQVGTDAYDQYVDNDGNQRVLGVREATVSVQRIGVDSDVKVADFRDNLARITVQEAWWVAGVSLYDVADIANVPFLMDDSHLESRSNLDLFVRFGTELLDNVGIIETVVTESEFS